jgi:hypothetical protein
VHDRSPAEQLRKLTLAFERFTRRFKATKAIVRAQLFIDDNTGGDNCALFQKSTWHPPSGYQ